MGSLRDRIAAIDDGHSERVTIPEWDNIELEVRSVTVDARAELYRLAANKDGSVDPGMFVPALVIASAYDPETGEQAFSWDDVDMLRTKSAAAVDRISKIVMRVGGFDEDGVEQGKDGS